MVNIKSLVCAHVNGKKPICSSCLNNTHRVSKIHSHRKRIFFDNHPRAFSLRTRKVSQKKCRIALINIHP